MTALLALVLLTGQVGSAMQSGLATWYAGTEGHAAAGPDLRVGDWRGSTVRVCAESCITVTLSDWCACGDRNGQPTLLDLSRADFAKLGDPSRGVLAVTVEWGGQAPTPPATDAVWWSWPGGGPR